MDAMDADDNLSDASLIEDDDEEEELIIQTSEQEYDEDVCVNNFTKIFLNAYIKNFVKSHNIFKQILQYNFVQFREFFQ